MGRTADAIEEGLSIASAAARLTVRNHILVETIANDEPLTTSTASPHFAHETLVALADEQKDGSQPRTAPAQRGMGQVQRLERHARLPRPRHPQPEASPAPVRGVAKELRRRADDPDAVARTGRAGSGCRVGRRRVEPAAPAARRGHATRVRPRLRDDARGAHAGAAAGRSAAAGAPTGAASARRSRRFRAALPARFAVCPPWSSLSSLPRREDHAPVAQWIEHLTTDQKVGSSSLFGRTLC